MRTIEKYISKQLRVPVLGAILALTGVAMLSQSLGQFDAVIGHGQSPLILLKITLFAMPQLFSLVLPMALMVGIVACLSRMHSDQEFIACFTSGMSLKQICSPILRLAILISVVSLMINLLIEPFATRLMRQELFKIKTDILSTLVREGEFSTSDSGLTIYVQRIEQNGLLRQIFIRAPENSFEETKTVEVQRDLLTDKQALNDRTYSAKEGRIVNKNGHSVLIMKSGSTQQLSSSKMLDHLTFKEYSFDITDYFVSKDFLHFKESDRYLHELFFPNMQMEWEKNNWKKLFAEGHLRLATPLYNLAFALLGIVGVLAGRFNRTGYSRRIGIAVFIAIFTRIVGIGIEAACADVPWLNFLQYLVPLIPIFVCLRLISRNDSVVVNREPAFINLSDLQSSNPLLLAKKGGSI